MATTGGGCNSGSTNRPNVSVTSINCDGHNSPQANPISSGASSVIQTPINGTHYYGNGGGIRISVPKMEQSDEESDTELTNIENTAIVNMRNRTNSTDAAVPRPMSWEGELSETEDGMDTEHQTPSATVTSQLTAHPVPATYANIESQAAQNDSKYETSATPLPLLTKDAIKPEYETLPIDSMPATQQQHHQQHYNHGNKKMPTEMVNLKFEPGLHDASQANSPLLARSKTATLLPANPSPDSAIHSHYTHSSPSESPLTSRHAPYTPSLSRNNSDASHSSCYSYSSEFSPTHSPIQGRHMYSNNFNGSPLHHSVLYRPMMENSGGSSSTGEPSVLRTTTHQQHEDSILESEAIPSAGISRQQLINR